MFHLTKSRKKTAKEDRSWQHRNMVGDVICARRLQFELSCHLVISVLFSFGAAVGILVGKSVLGHRLPAERQNLLKKIKSMSMYRSGQLTRSPNNRTINQACCSFTFNAEMRYIKQACVWNFLLNTAFLKQGPFHMATFATSPLKRYTAILPLVQ